MTCASSEAWPAVAPHNRHNQHHASSFLLVKRVCLILLLIGVAWRAWQLDEVPGVNGDEAWYGVQSQRFLDEYLYGKSLLNHERVTFRTPTGNLWNPFLMIPRVLLDATFAPSVWSLRLPALVSGVLTLLVNWWFCRRTFNRTTAWLTTALLAVLPIAVIYSRLGWDACQSILFSLPLVYLPWYSERRALSGARTAIYYSAALLAALLVHPTNIFLVPLGVLLFWPRVSAAAQLELSLRTRVLLAAAAVGGALGVGILRGSWSGVEPGNLFSAVTQWASDVIGLFHGATVYGSISLPADELPTAQSWLLLLSLPTIAIVLWVRIRCKTPLFTQLANSSLQRYAALFDATALALLCFLGVAGPAAILPGYERYALWLVAPGVLLLVLAYSFLSFRSRAAQRGMAVLAVIQGTFLVVGYWQYFQRRFAVPATAQRLAHWTYRADQFADWPEMRQELERALFPDIVYRSKSIELFLQDPQRWWFEWKWRYLSYGSDYQWRVRPISQMLIGQEAAARWSMSSRPDSEKEKLSIQFLSN